jgi:hypothetical protein
MPSMSSLTDRMIFSSVVGWPGQITASEGSATGDQYRELPECGRFGDVAG